MLRRDRAFLVILLGAERQQPIKVLITARRFNVEHKRMVADLQFCSEDGFDARVLRGLRELYGTVQIADVGQSDCRHAMLFGEIHNGCR